jgi:GMP synthase (glutamine-hydrolysing)
MTLKCLAVRHLAFENLGSFDAVLAERGFDIAYLDAGVQPTDAATLLEPDLLVVLGGPIGVNDVAVYPWLQAEIDAVRERVLNQRPTLGVGLGAQIIATALGARVYPGKAKEIGWAPVTLSPAGQGSPLRHLAGSPTLHWHGDTFDIPEGARLLASTELTPHQAFDWGDQVLALQFHPEFRASDIEAWLVGHTMELSLAKVDIPALRAATAVHGQAQAAAGRAMLSDWLGKNLLVSG